jgi:rhodanese-related sulfurtransferase
LLPLAVLVDSLDQLDRDAPVVVNCAGGYRSVVGASLLRHAGFADVSDLLGGFGAWSAAGLPVSVGSATAPDAVEVTPLAAADLVERGAVVIDVREEDEWTAGHMPTSRLIPMVQVEGHVDELREVASAVVVCRTGGRSNAITQVLNSAGINAVNLAGGMRAWEEAGLPVVTEGGEPGRIV